MLEFLKSTGFLSPYGTMGADISSVMAWVFTLLFMYGWHLAKKHQGQRHHTLTLWGMIAMLGYFTTYYLARGLGALATEGKEGFGGPDWAYSYIFLPMLNIHILVISVGLVLAVYMIVLGFRTYLKKEGRMTLRSAPLTMTSKAVRNVLIGTGLLFGGVAIVRWGPVERFYVYLSGFLLVAFVILLERWLENRLPDGADRHRKIGTLTMILYAVALITSTGTYVLLYFIYPVKEVVGG